MEFKIYTDIRDCQALWEKLWPEKELFDLWQVRACFHDQFQRPLRFHTVESGGKVLGFLPLSWCEESNRYVFFPGETWHGKTWIEQNRVIARDKEILQMLIQAVPGPVHLRYLSPNPLLDTPGRATEDEKGYLFYPGIFDYDFENYWLGFSGKSRKNIKKEMAALEALNVSFRFNELADLEDLFLLNTTSFVANSYFHDPRFHASFQQLAVLLKEMGCLRMTSIRIGGQTAAVDMGAVFNNTYTLLAGGTSPCFKGVAKLINLHHIEWACKNQIGTVDFLCGDFNWKERFHLTPRPLYLIDGQAPACPVQHLMDSEGFHIRGTRDQIISGSVRCHEERICA